MVSIDAAALERVFSSVDVRMGAGRRIELDADGILPLASGTITLIYVTEGTLFGHPPLSGACTVDVTRGGRSLSLSTRSGRDRLARGDAFLALGTRSIALRSDGGGEVMVVELQLSDTATMLCDLLPEFLTVTDFAGLEPAAAALAQNMGHTDPQNTGHSDSEEASLRSGDPVICRLMTTTVLLSVVRAWAENGCAPAGWPSRANDPFLERVVEAIHAEPGRDWTVETLASVGAMSRTVFAERFRAELGSSPAHYVTGVRMDVAKGMLDAGRSVSDTSRSLGYASDEGFSRAFRRATGVTPSTWRATRSTLVSA